MVVLLKKGGNMDMLSWMIRETNVDGNAVDTRVRFADANGHSLAGLAARLGVVVGTTGCKVGDVKLELARSRVKVEASSPRESSPARLLDDRNRHSLVQINRRPLFPPTHVSFDQPREQPFVLSSHQSGRCGPRLGRARALPRSVPVVVVAAEVAFVGDRGFEAEQLLLVRRLEGRR